MVTRTIAHEQLRDYISGLWVFLYQGRDVIQSFISIPNDTINSSGDSEACSVKRMYIQLPSYKFQVFVCDMADFDEFQMLSKTVRPLRDRLLI
jgi:hypothetical protein